MAAEEDHGTSPEATGRMLSLKDVERELGISYPTLLRYKNEHADRIPSEGTGRSQRYPEEALEVFRAIYRENTNRRPSGGSGRKRSRRTKSASTEGMLSLKDVQRETGISYPTLRKYVKEHGDEIPSKGRGRRRRYPPEAVEVFRSIRERKGRGGRPRKKSPSRSAGGRSTGASASVDRRLAGIEKSLERLARQMEKLEKELKKPLKIVR